jgi:hypothetical protein
MEWLGSFLSDFKADEEAQEHQQSRETSTRSAEVKAKKPNDREQRNAVLSETFTSIDWACNSKCTFGKRCKYAPGFLEFMVQLRESFWGPAFSDPPTAKERMEKIQALCKKYHT